ncbi:ABC transporter ATP-binding protein [Fimbriiglobus ruber]|uniref:ABC transporter ATP-binding protein n=1 Tax=Fimbriiglobus ruber TaxID=1908690 RepID=A0A225D8E0_9BACT|nr:ABC transporter ATP-binding protein [Fimbriiglobus ruber]
MANLRCSRKHFQIVLERGRYFVEALAKGNPTFLDGREVVGRTPLAHGSLLRAGECDFRFLLAATAPPPVPATFPAAPAGQPVEQDESQTVSVSASQVTELLALGRNIRLAGSMLIGRDADAHIPLVHPQVSRRHAIIDRLADGRVVLRDLGSANGTFVNGARLTTRPVPLKPGDQINIGPYGLVFSGTELVSKNRVSNIELIADEVTRVVTDRQTGKKLKLLDGITLVFQPREFVCLLGPSGSGKSTLMTILSGRSAPDRGTVFVNGQDLHANFDALKKDLALVPQKDVLHDSLTLGQALRYTARLRLPPDTSRAEADVCIQEILNTVSLTHRHGTVIRELSGGQVKRACLANEILCKPNLLFLDEVTSGLDERTDSDMMDLFRQIAHDGKTVVCITHSLANVERACDLVVILTPGGKLAFVGSPAEAKTYFGIDRLGLVYDLLEDKDVRPPEYWQERFLDSPYYAKYVTGRLPRGRGADAAEVVQPRVGSAERVSLFLRQAAVLTRRYLAIWRSNKASLAAMIGQSLIVALLLIIVFGDLSNLKLVEKASRTVNLLFLLAISSFWFGCNNAAKEVVKERVIFTRERDFNLLSSSYFLSKLVVLCGFSFLQTFVLFGLTKTVCGPPGDGAGQIAVLLALAAAGTTLGLLISTLATSEEMAITLIPMAVIPQIILSGTIAPLSGFGKGLALSGITTYWGKRGLDALLPDDLARTARAANVAEDGSLALSLALIALHCFCFVAATLIIMTLRGLRTTLKLQKVKRTAHG